ncbi:hypothetical protein M413DRAFT_442886 [Hebeloma cylindrosporum]|uniref:ADF-H domain-containing protein n=1 Tax=Hebeloma cylindrosporum TaxID=76867 RepID=A0A0C2Y4W5_HEBCY|nr:hypothetical protein M413DRAFT_442886 [Hebeloma cylindrosporum h7]
MALNMSDPAAVMAVYSSILEDGHNWLLLHYVNDSYDELELHSYGEDGLEELKTKLSNDKVFFAFYREELDSEPGYIIINYIPPSVSGVRRARALVHSRRIGAILKRHQTIFTVDSLSLLTADNIHRAINNPEIPLPSATQNTSSRLGPPNNERPQESRDILIFESVGPSPPTKPGRTKGPKPITSDMARRSFTATYAPNVQPPTYVPPVPPLPKGVNLFQSFLRRKKKGSTDDPNENSAPPTPPKDKGGPQPISVSLSAPVPSRPAVRRQRSRSMSDFAVISHEHDELIVEPEEPFHQGDHSESYISTLRSKWSQDATLSSDPAERARRRRELQLRMEQEEQQALEEETERQRRIKQEKEELLQKEQEEENRRKVEVEEEIRRVTFERRRREQQEKEEEERKKVELEERKRLDRERRLEEHRRLEEWRKEQKKRADAAAREAERVRLQEEAERKQKIKEAEAKVKRTKGEANQTGWITILGSDSISWKRRYYKFVGNSIYLYRSPKDLGTTLDKVDLRGNVRGLKEWNEGYEDLEAIAFSFVVEFKTERKHWSMYADSEEEKYRILGLLKIAAGL